MTRAHGGGLAVAAVLVAASGCGGSSPGSFNGTVLGYSLTVRDAIMLRQQDTSQPGATGFTITLLMSDTAGLCARLATPGNALEPPNSTDFQLTFASQDQTGTLLPLVPGLFPAYNLAATPTSQNYAQGEFDKVNSACQNTTPNNGTTVPSNQTLSGTATLKTLGLDAGVPSTGTFDINFASGDRVSGSFNAKFCDEPVPGIPSRCQ